MADRHARSRPDSGPYSRTPMSHTPTSSKVPRTPGGTVLTSLLSTITFGYLGTPARRAAEPTTQPPALASALPAELPLPAPAAQPTPAAPAPRTPVASAGPAPVSRAESGVAEIIAALERSALTLDEQEAESLITKIKSRVSRAQGPARTASMPATRTPTSAQRPLLPAESGENRFLTGRASGATPTPVRSQGAAHRAWGTAYGVPSASKRSVHEEFMSPSAKRRAVSTPTGVRAEPAKTPSAVPDPVLSDKTQRVLESIEKAKSRWSLSPMAASAAVLNAASSKSQNAAASRTPGASGRRQHTQSRAPEIGTPEDARMPRRSLSGDFLQQRVEELEGALARAESVIAALTDQKRKLVGEIRSSARATTSGAAAAATAMEDEEAERSREEEAATERSLSKRNRQQEGGAGPVRRARRDHTPSVPRRSDFMPKSSSRAAPELSEPAFQVASASTSSPVLGGAKLTFSFEAPKPAAEPSQPSSLFGVEPPAQLVTKEKAADKAQEKPAAEGEKKEKAPQPTLSFSFGTAAPSSGSEPAAAKSIFGTAAPAEPAAKSIFGAAAPAEPAVKPIFGSAAAAEPAAAAPSFGAPAGEKKEEGAKSDPISAFFKQAAAPKEGWKCPCCETQNTEKDKTCQTCMVNRPKDEKKEEKPAGWKCPCCEAQNTEAEATCNTCMVNRPTKPVAAAEKKKEEPASLFSFGNAAAAAAPADSKEAPAFSFGAAAPAASASGFSFGADAAAAPKADLFAPAPAAEKAKETPAPADAEKKESEAAAEGWKCPECQAFNDEANKQCRLCSAARKKTPKTTAPAPSFSFGSAAETPAVPSIFGSAAAKKDEAPAFTAFAPSAPSVSASIFGAAAKPEEAKKEEPPAAEKTPASSFGTPASGEKKADAPSSAVSFGAEPEKKAESPAPAPVPLFGAALAESSKPEQPAASPAASSIFGAAAAPAESSAGTSPAPALPPFAFGAPADKKPDADAPAPALAFGAAAASEKKPELAFSFGAPGAAPKADSLFGGASAAAPAFGAKPAEQASSPVPPAFGSAEPAKPAAAPAFAFGALPSSTSTPPPAAPAFGFGSPAGDKPMFAEVPFEQPKQAAPAATTVAPFGFGAAPAAAPAASSPAPFAFGAPASAAAPTFGAPAAPVFGAPAAAPAFGGAGDLFAAPTATSVPVPSTFAFAAPAPSASPVAPSFGFGTTAAQSFGSVATGAPPMFGATTATAFGAPAAAAPGAAPAAMPGMPAAPAGVPAFSMGVDSTAGQGGSSSGRKFLRGRRHK
eukprot:m51a1_g11622 hypothetical protein (1270) ;mRNA; r:31999-37159